MTPKISAKRVNELGAEYSRQVIRWGEHNLSTQRAFQAYREAVARWEKETGRTWGQPNKRRKK